MHLLCCKGWKLRCSPGRGNPRGCVVVLYMGEGSKREQCRLLRSLPPLPTSKLGPSGADSRVGGFVYVHSRTLWASPVNSPVRMGVSPAAASTPTGCFSQRFEALFPCTGALGCAVCHSPVVPPGLSAPECGTWLTSHCLTASTLRPGCLSLPLLPVWMNVYFLFPWCRTSLLFDFLSVLVVRGGAVCLPTPPSWFSSQNF